MKIGIFGTPSDPQVSAVAAIAEKRGVDVVVLDSQALNGGMSHVFDGSRFTVGGVDISECRAWYLRHTMSPLPPPFQKDDAYRLYADWFIEYMRRRERFGFQLSFLLSETFAGVPVVNPPEHGSVSQMKPFQLRAAREVGLVIPATCVTNDPNAVRKFARKERDVVFKPSMGGGPCVSLDDEAMARLDDVVASPVIFQARVRGDDVRVTLVGDEIVSAVVIPSATLDFRDDPDYRGGRTVYEEVVIPDVIKEKLVALMRATGLVFSGIDLKRTKAGDYVFFEANSSPIYLDVERKTGAPITDKLVSLLLSSANAPEAHRRRIDEALHRTRSFVRYALPFAPDKLID